MKKKMNLTKSTKSTLITLGIVVVGYIVLQTLMQMGAMSSLMKGLLVPICIYAIMAVSLNLTVGILGELSLGHAGFMCIGAFVSAFFSLCFKETMAAGPRFLIAIILGGIFAALSGFLIGIPVLRLRGDYLAIVTLAFGEIIKNIINVLYIGKDENGFHFSTKDAFSMNMSKEGQILINGAQGITGTPNNSNFTVAVILLVITLIIVLNLVHSRSGRAIMAIRDNRIAAESVGINITQFKLLAFSISAGLAGIAGVLYAHNLSILQAQPKNFGYNMSIMILVYVVLGGIGNIRGSMIASIILVLLPELMRELNDYRMLIYSIVLIVMMLFNWSPKAKELRARYSLKRLLGKKTAKEEI